MAAVGCRDFAYISNEEVGFVMVTNTQNVNFIKHFISLNEITSMTVSWTGMFIFISAEPVITECNLRCLYLLFVHFFCKTGEVYK